MTPTDFFAGDTAKFTLSLPDYPATAWSMQFALRGVSALTVTAYPTGSGTDFGVTLAASQSATLTPGSYEWVAQVTSGSEAYTATSGRLTVKPNVMTSTAGTRQTHVERALAAIEAVLESRITADVMAYTIAGRSVTKIPLNELRILRASYAKELYHLKRADGALGKPVYIRFTPPTE